MVVIVVTMVSVVVVVMVVALVVVDTLVLGSELISWKFVVVADSWTFSVDGPLFGALWLSSSFLKIVDFLAKKKTYTCFSEKGKMFSPIRADIKAQSGGVTLVRGPIDVVA